MANWSVFPNASELAFMNMMFFYDGNIYFHLFQNQHGMSDATVLSDLTECNYTGYSPITLSIGSATEDTYSAGGYSGKQAGFPVQTLNFPANSGGSGQTCYGLYATYFDPNGVEQLLYGANVFDTSGSYTPTPSGITIAPSALPPTLFGQAVLWDFNQPTGPQ